MKAISVIQPWATLIATGKKKIETRSWRTNYRGELLIHGSRKVDSIMLQEPFYSALGRPRNNQMINGVIVARCRIAECLQIVDQNTLEGCAYLAKGAGYEPVRGNEYHFGDYSPGRYAWILEDVERFERPIPAKGKLGLWDIDLM